MKSQLERMCNDHMAEMALARTIMNIISVVLTSLVTLKVFELI